jgi:hypothetical protein
MSPPIATLNVAPEGYTRHHQDGKTMILVDKDIHRQFTHTGGVSTVNGKNKGGYKIGTMNKNRKTMML